MTDTLLFSGFLVLGLLLVALRTARLWGSSPEDDPVMEPPPKRKRSAPDPAHAVGWTVFSAPYGGGGGGGGGDGGCGAG